MKKQLVLGLGLAVLAAPAFASKARLQALGESVNGSFYINDNRNIFLNSAQVNNQKDLITFEWGTGGATDSNTNNSAPNAEGGAYKSYNNMVYGIHLGRDLSFNSGVDTLSTTAFAASNAIDLFVGGDAGFKWGANLTYATSSNEDKNAATLKDAEAKAMDLNVGATFGDFTAYVKAGLMGNSTDKKDVAGAYDIKRKSSYEIGGSYQLNDYTIFGQYSMNDFENKRTSPKNKSENQSFLVGAGRNDKVTEKTTLFTKVQFSQNKNDIKNSAVATNDSKSTSQAIPVIVGLEHDATSWLTVRGSISQNLWSKNKDTKKKTESTTANSTDVNAGATLKFGDLSFDGVVGTNTNNNAGVGANTTTEKGILSLDNLMTRVSMTYRF